MNKQKQFEELLKKKGIHLPKGAVLMRRDDPGPYPLSFAQRRIWFLQQFDTSSAAYNDPTALRLKGSLNIPALEKTFNEILRRHQVLRMTFPAQKGQPVMVPHANDSITITVMAFSQWPGFDAGKGEEDQVSAFVNWYSGQAFDLAGDLLVRAVLLKIAEDDYALVVNIHHIVMDGWSKGIMLQELMVLYEAFCAGKSSPLAELPVRYTDYVHWHHEWMQGKMVEAQLSYWRQKLAGAPPILELPTDRPRPHLPQGGGSLVPFSFSPGLFQSLNTLARQQDVTFFMVMMAAFNTLLYRYSAQDDILVGTPVAGRNRVELENLIGLFVNTLVIRSDLSGHPTFETLLGRIRTAALEAYSHQDIPFEKLVEELNPQRNLSVTPLFQVMFQLQNAPMPPAHISGLTITPIQIDTGYSQVDLSLTLWEEQGIMKGTFEYNTDLFEASTIKRMVSHFLLLLEGITADPGQEISYLPLLSEEEKHRLVKEWNDTDSEYPRELCIFQLFEACAARNPGEEAVIFGQQRLTYSRLHRQANALALRLQQMKVGPDTLVGICMENSPQLITGVMGILMAGGVYIPMDPAYPGERLLTILRDARPRVLITQSSLINRFSGYTGEIIVLGAEAEAEAAPSGDRNTGCTPAHAACVIYTSGSTGEPRGIIIDQGSIVNLIFSFLRSYEPGPGDRILPLTSIASASFVGEILPMVTSGGGVVLADKVHFLDMKKLMQLITDYRVTILSTVPSMIARLNGSQWNPGGLRLLLSGGEALSAADIDRLQESVTIVNGYGLTEATICSTFVIVNQDKTILPGTQAISVGKPIINTQVFILDNYQTLVPIGVPGELYIGGTGVARGYLNEPELTSERFLARIDRSYRTNRTYSTEKLFKTGDLGAWQADGTIKFLGRIDTQVQVHGYRIELAEIETHLGLHPDIQDVVVIDREIAAGERRLAAYFVTARENGEKRVSPGSALLRDWLGKRIPVYMVPAIYIEVDAIPLTVNGKVDIKALPEPAPDRPELSVDYKAPDTETEKAIAAVWQEFLRLDKVGINDNFFDLGGHSLLLTQVHSRLSEILANKKELTIVDFFRYPTIRALAGYIDESGKMPQGEEVYRGIRDRAARQREAFSRKSFNRGRTRK